MSVFSEPRDMPADGGGGGDPPKHPGSKPSPGHIVFDPSRGPSVVALPGFDATPEVVGGYGGWGQVARPQRTALTRWDGFEPLQVDVPILLDRDMQRLRVENQRAALERMAGRGPGAQGKPPTVKVTSHGNLVPHENEHLWVVTGIDWGDPLLDEHGHRIRVQATVHLMQSVEDENEKLRSAAQRHGEHKRRHAHHVVRKGETLQKISREEYGTPDRYRAIQTANGIRDPRIVGKTDPRRPHRPRPGYAGSRLKIPK